MWFVPIRDLSSTNNVFCVPHYAAWWYSKRGSATTNLFLGVNLRPTERPHSFPAHIWPRSWMSSLNPLGSQIIYVLLGHCHPAAHSPALAQSVFFSRSRPVFITPLAARGSCLPRRSSHFAHHLAQVRATPAYISRLSSNTPAGRPGSPGFKHRHWCRPVSSTYLSLRHISFHSCAGLLHFYDTVQVLSISVTYAGWSCLATRTVAYARAAHKQQWRDMVQIYPQTKCCHRHVLTFSQFYPFARFPIRHRLGLFSIRKTDPLFPISLLPSSSCSSFSWWGSHFHYVWIHHILPNFYLPLFFQNIQYIYFKLRSFLLIIISLKIGSFCKLKSELICICHLARSYLLFWLSALSSSHLVNFHVSSSTSWIRSTIAILPGWL